MKKLLLVSLLLISGLIYSQSPGKYSISHYQIDDGSSKKSISNAMIDITKNYITVDLGVGDIFHYDVFSIEKESNKTIYMTADDLGRVCQFIVGKKSNFWLIMSSDKAGSVFYFSPKVTFY